MQRISKSSLTTAVVAAALAFGFGQRAASAADDISAATARDRIEDLKVGTELGTNGAVLDNKDDIAAGQKVYASFKADDIPAGSAVRAIWKGPGGERLAMQTVPVPMGAKFVVFVAPDTTLWKPGEYRVDIRLGDELGGHEDFKIREADVD
jgi:hypothetical protein